MIWGQKLHSASLYPLPQPIVMFGQIYRIASFNCTQLGKYASSEHCNSCIKYQIPKYQNTKTPNTKYGMYQTKNTVETGELQVSIAATCIMCILWHEHCNCFWRYFIFICSCICFCSASATSWSKSADQKHIFSFLWLLSGVGLQTMPQNKNKSLTKPRRSWKR